MTTVAVEQAQKDLARLIDDVVHGEHIIITRNHVPVAELVPASRSGPKRTFGSARGLVRIAEDFEAPIEDFGDYVG